MAATITDDDPLGIRNNAGDDDPLGILSKEDDDPLGIQQAPRVAPSPEDDPFSRLDRTMKDVKVYDAPYGPLGDIRGNPDTEFTKALHGGVKDALQYTGDVARGLVADVGAGLSLFKRPENQEVGWLPNLSAIPNAVKENLPYAAKASGNLPAAIRGDTLRGNPLPIDRILGDISEEAPFAATVGKFSQSLAASAPLLAVMPQGALGKLVAAGFTVDMLKHGGEAATMLGEEMGKPSDQRDHDKITTALSSLASSVAFAPLTGAHAGGKALGERIAPRREAIRELANELKKEPQTRPQETRTPRPQRELGLRLPDSENVLASPEASRLADVALQERRSPIEVPGRVPAIEMLRRELDPQLLEGVQPTRLAERVEGGGEAPYGKVSYRREAEAPTVTPPTKNVPDAAAPTVEDIRASRAAEKAAAKSPVSAIEDRPVAEWIKQKQESGFKDQTQWSYDFAEKNPNVTSAELLAAKKRAMEAAKAVGFPDQGMKMQFFSEAAKWRQALDEAQKITNPTKEQLASIEKEIGVGGPDGGKELQSALSRQNTPKSGDAQTLQRLKTKGELTPDEVAQRDALQKKSDSVKNLMADEFAKLKAEIAAKKAASESTIEATTPLDPQSGSPISKIQSFLEKADARLAEIQAGIRSGKSQFTGITGLEPAIADAALTAARGVLKATGSTAKAISAAIDYIRKNHPGLKFDSEAFRKHLLENVGDENNTPVQPKALPGTDKAVAESPAVKPAAETPPAPLQGETVSRDQAKPTTAMGYQEKLPAMDYITETEAGRNQAADTILKTFGDDLDAAVRALSRPPEMSGVPASIQIVAAEKIARQAAANERQATNLADADKWAETRRNAQSVARAELSKSGQSLQSGAQLKREYIESGAGVVERAEREFSDLKDLDKNFPELSRETKQKIYDLAEQADKLKKLSEAEIAGKTPEQIEQLKRQKEAFTARERLRLKTEIETELAREKLKNGWRGWLTPEGRKARAKVMNEIISANLLTTPTFLTKQPIDVATQYAYHTATRALAQVMQLPRSGSIGERSAQFTADLGHEVLSSLKDIVNSRQAALRYGVEGAKGRGSHFRDTIGLSGDMKFLERAEKDVAQAIKDKKPWKAIIPLYLSTIKIGLREAKFLDELSGTMVENVEIRQQIEKGLRDAGATPKEARTQARDVAGNMVAEYALAEKQAQLFVSQAKLKVPPSEFKAMVWDLVHQNQLERARNLNMPVDAIEAGAVDTGRTFAWNQREVGHGPGGALLGSPLESIRKYLEKIGVPSPFTAFGNAISIGSNRAITHAGLGLFPGLFEGSPFYKTPKDITQRKIEAVVGLGVATLFGTLAYNGNIRVRNQLSSNPDEKEKQIAEGRKGGTVEINVGDGKYIPVSLSTGPLSAFRIPLSIIGALQEKAEKNAKKEEQAKAEAEKFGLTLSGAVTDSEDLLGVMLGAASTGMFGGRTLGGLQQQFVNQDNALDWKRPLTGAATAMVPLLPAVKSSERIAGVDIDSKRASVMSMILPSAISGAGTDSARLNDWGDPVNEQNWKRVTGILTGGTVPAKLGDISDPIKKLAIEAGWSPPSFQDRLYQQEGDILAKFPPGKRDAFLKFRGNLIKSIIADTIKENPEQVKQMKPEDWTPEFREAFKEANAEAKEKFGITK